ncbi:Cell division protein FtsI [Minicystis rosea]|nr:Cell division protein FtsI [Minicystis rosea]
MSVSVALLAAFHLLVNAIGSFLVGALVVGLAARAFRVGPGRVQQALFSIPFLKVVWDAAHGIPQGSYFWARLDGVEQRLGSFMAGAGFEVIVPRLHIAFASTTDRGKLASTVADFAAVGLSRHVAPRAPMVIAAVVLVIGAARVARRIARLVHGEGERDRLLVSARLIDTRSVRGREVSVLVSTRHHGAPFTGGLLRPYVCFPAATFAMLTPEGREAALLHELAHVAHRDLLLATVLDVLGDLLWFVPATRVVRRRFDAATEHLADRAAVRAGAAPVALATALLCVREALASDSTAAASALVRPRAELARRIEALLGRAPRPRLHLERAWVGALFIAWIAAVALRSTLGGHI